MIRTLSSSYDTRREESSLVAEIQTLYDQGRYSEAIARGASLGDLRAWDSRSCRLLAGRLAYRVGRPRLGQAHFFRARRLWPDDAEVLEFFGGVVLGRRGADAALELVRRFPRFREVPRLVAFEAAALADLRDFERAHQGMAHAIARLPSDPWLHTEHASVFEQEDRIDEALEALDRALRIRPGFRPALLRKSRVLAHRGGDAQALELLLDSRVDGSFELLADRAAIRLRLRDYAGADADLERAEASTVAAEPAVLSALRHRRAEVAYLRRDYARAARLICASPHRPFARFAKALEGLAPDAELPRVELDLPIIRQLHMTCAPASLASIAQFHGDPVDHNSIAFAICYAGTPTHHSRAWAEGRGYVATEFDVTLDSARRVLDAGLPFVLSTVATCSAHAQVVVGYDLARETILVRDPSRPELVEFDFALLEAQAFHGPHGLVFAPGRHEAMLQALELPNRAAWDARHRIAVALEAHDLPSARRALAELEAQSPGSIHALSAAHAVANYVGDRGQAIAALDALLERFPRAHSLVVARACAMRGRHSVSEVIAYLERYRDRDDPALLSMLADHLRCIPARRAEAERLFRRALRHAPWDGATHHALADLLCHAPDELPETLERYRFGALLSEHDEHFALAYFDELCRTGSADAGFRFLEWRAERAEHRSCGPAVTLFEAYLGAGDPERGVQALERLEASRPDDGDLVLRIAAAHLANGNPGRARESFARLGAKPAHEVDRLATRARLARTAGRLDETRVALEEAHRLAPERLDVASDYARVLEELEGPEAAIAFLETMYSEHPNVEGLLGRLVAHLRDRASERAIALLEARASAHPEDTWARRELALLLAQVGRFEDAIATAMAAHDREPHEAWSHTTLASCLRSAGRFDEARASLRRAIALEPNTPWAVHTLAELPSDPESAREDARHVLSALEASPGTGRALAAAIEIARVLEAEERSARLARIFAEVSRWPEPTIAWIERAIHEGDLDEAERLGRAALERFPRWFRLHERLAEIARLRGDREGQEAMLRRLLELSPGHAPARAALGLALRERGALDEALAIVEEGQRISPLSTVLFDARARIFESMGASAEAFEARLSAVRADVARDRDVVAAIGLGKELGRLDELEALLRERAEADQAGATPLLRLASLYEGTRDAELRIATLAQAVRRAPFDPDVIDQYVTALVSAGRYDDALREVDTTAFGRTVPLTLRGRRAWVLHRAGRIEDAIEAARAVLVEAPGYSWLRANLCDWHDERGEMARFLEHARALSTHAPNEARSHVYLGDALVANRERAAALDAFVRAVQLDPSNTYAARTLIDLLLERERWDDAEESLARTRHCIAPGAAHALDARIAANRRDWDRAHDSLASALAHPCEEAVLSAACDAIARGPRLGDAFALFQSRLADPNGDGEDLAVPNVYARLCAAHRPRERIRLVGRAGSLGPTGVVTAASILEGLASTKERFTFLLILALHGRLLRRIGQLWGSTGFVFASFGYPRLAYWWLRRFHREDARPWMLLNFVDAAWQLGDYELADAAAQRALTLPRDHATDRHRLWLALSARIAGRESHDADVIETIPHGKDHRETIALHLVRAIDAARARNVASVAALLEAVTPHLARAARRVASDPRAAGAYRAAFAVITEGLGLLDRWRLQRAVRAAQSGESS